MTKTKTMAFTGKYPIRTKIILENTMLEQVSRFKYLGYDITFFTESDIGKKIQKYQYICGTIRRTLKDKTRRDTLMRVYNVMAVPSLLFRSECWTMREKDKQALVCRNEIP